MPRVSPSLPQLKRHAASGRAYTVVDGRFFYFGRHGTAAAREAYDRFIAEFLQRGRTLPVDQTGVTVAEVAAAFWRHAKVHYRRPDGSHTGQLPRVKASLTPLRQLYGRSLAAEFGPLALKAVREKMVEEGLSRTTINARVQVIRQAFRHAVGNEMIPGHVWEALRAVPGLQRGRTRAKEPDPVKPVPQAHIDAVLPLVASPVAALVRLQLLTGARPGELLNLRPIDLDTGAKTWAVRLEDHKTAHHAKARVIYLGPEARKIIRPFLVDRPVTSPLFSAREGLAELRARGAKVRRRFGQKATKRQSPRRVADAYSVDSYRRAIERACITAGVPTWSPNRLRHNAATELRKRFGVDVAGVILGHAHGSIVTAQVYAEADMEKARRVIEKVG